MPAFDAAIILMETIKRVLNPPPHVWIKPTNPESLEDALDELLSLNQIFDASDIEDDFDSRDGFGFRGRLENALELFGSHFSNHFPSEYRGVKFAYGPILQLMNSIWDSEMLRESSLRELKGAADSLLPKLKRSVVFEGEIEEEEINSLAQTIATVNEDPQLYVDGNRAINGLIGKIETMMKEYEIDEKEEEEINSFLQKIRIITIYSEETYSSPSELEEEEIYSFLQNIRRITEEKKVDGWEWDEEEIVSLTQTICRFKKHEWRRWRHDDDEYGNLRDQFEGFLNFAHKVLESLLRRLSRNRSDRSSERLDNMDGQIREAIHTFEDKIEYLQLDTFLSQSESPKQLDLHNLNREISPFIQLVKKLKEEYINELLKPLPGEDDIIVSSKTGFCRNESEMVGLSDVFDEIRDKLVDPWSWNMVHILTGMAGIGKTALAKKLFEDQSIMSCFDLRVWVTVGPKFQMKKIMQDMLTQVVNPDHNEETRTEGDENLSYHLSKSLEDKRRLIVLDDVWERDIWEYVRIVLDKVKEIRVLITTRREYNYFDPKVISHRIRFLNKDESWNLLREKVFGDNESCPPQLVKAGKKIAKHCEGLPLTIVTVAKILSKAETTPTPEHWSEVADKKTSVFKDAYNQMMDVLYPSYMYLPQHLKAFFLYMGVFPQNHEMSISKLKMMWSAEGLYNELYHGYPSFYASECLGRLYRESVVLRDPSLKTCSLHSAIWHMCTHAAYRSKFFHALTYSADGLPESIKSQRRVCIHKNMLFGIKVVSNSLASSPATRSLLCTGLYHPYPVPIYFGLKLLKVLDSLNVRFYEFPMQLKALFMLRYLALTCDGEPPAFISQLWNLRYLILSRHQRIINLNEDELYLPTGIWDMKELRHLQVMGSNLPNPPHEGVVLPNLVKLLDVSPRSCTVSVFQALPRLAKLGIRIELAPNSVDQLLSNDQLLSCFNHISLLRSLKSLECVIVNPVFMPELPRAPLSITSSTLESLTLSGCGYSWEDMGVIAALPSLTKLKLQCYAFRGPNWEVEENGFPSLFTLIIEDTDLVHWKAREGALRYLNGGFGTLILKNCYKLKEIPKREGVDERPFGKAIKLFDCSRSAVKSAEQIKLKYPWITLDIHSSLGVFGNHN